MGLRSFDLNQLFNVNQLQTWVFQTEHIIKIQERRLSLVQTIIQRVKLFINKNNTFYLN